MHISLRKLKEQNLKMYGYWKLPTHAYHQLNGPYFKKETAEEIETEIKELKKAFEEGNENPLPRKRMIIYNNNDLIGEVSWYWKSKETKWLEVGVVIFDEQFWKKGIGYQSLKLWIETVFNEKKEIIRIGLTTWSGNIGMLKVAEKLGLNKEAEYKKARIVNGVYYDSISYGILREEWEMGNRK